MQFNYIHYVSSTKPSQSACNDAITASQSNSDFLRRLTEILKSEHEVTETEKKDWRLNFD